MVSTITPLAGKPAPASILINVQKLIAAYYEEVPDPSLMAERVRFGTSGHRGCAFDRTFNEWHILAISQAICLYRKQHKIKGPLFLGIDTHALSMPAFQSSLEVFAANGLEVMLAKHTEYTPTPVISHAILAYNRDSPPVLADGVVITPSHNPPSDGGFKYNPPNGGPADFQITHWIEKKANEFLENNLFGVKRIPFKRALEASTTHHYDYLNAYVNDLSNVIDMNKIRDSNIRMGVDPMGGAGLHYWLRIKEQYGLNLCITNDIIDPTFKFMRVDWDGQLRMDPSSSYAMENLIELKDQFDVAFACDTDHDRHGIVTPTEGLIPSNHYLSVALSYLLQNRPQWNKAAAIGKTIVSSQMIDHIVQNEGQMLFEVPVGFKWFVEGLAKGALKFCGEESAGATFCRRTGSVWTTDKDGIILALLSAEITARLEQDLGKIYHKLEQELGSFYYKRIDVKATLEQKKLLKNLTVRQIDTKQLAGGIIQAIISQAPGNGMPIGGIKVSTDEGWFVVRPSDTENIYRIYAESFKSNDHLEEIVTEAQKIIKTVLHEKSDDGK
jgi:phosphoglucomutase